MAERDGVLADRTFIVTGTTKGIGQATVAELLARGARIAAIDIEASPQQWDEEVLSLKADVAQEDEVAAAIASAARELGPIHGLVNNAGIVLEKPLKDTSVDEFDRVIDVNLKGTFLASRAVLPFLEKNSEDPLKPRIINIASELAYLGREQYSIYCATKGAIISLTRSWAREFAPDILVNAIAPGPTDTDMLKSEKNYEAWVETAEGIPLGRAGLPEDVACMIAVMLGPDSRFMTGQIVGVNGGAVMQ